MTRPQATLPAGGRGDGYDQDGQGAEPGCTRLTVARGRAPSVPLAALWSHRCHAVSPAIPRRGDGA
jgi:hypothetical protein